MLKIRLKRVGKKRDSAFRIIVSPSSKSISSGKYLDQIGFYDPRIDKKDIDVDKAKTWIDNGAQPTDTVYNLLIDAGVIEGRKKNVLPQKSAPAVEGGEDKGGDENDAETANDVTDSASDEPSEGDSTEESADANSQTADDKESDATEGDSEPAKDDK
jgi:small subunit ribosomal protein S16